VKVLPAVNVCVFTAPANVNTRLCAVLFFMTGFFDMTAGFRVMVLEAVNVPDTNVYPKKLLVSVDKSKFASVIALFW